MNLLKYSLVKAIMVYRLEEVISSLYNAPNAFLNALRSFLNARIDADRENVELKRAEIEQFEIALLLLDDADEIKSFDWSYEGPLTGLKLFFEEKSVGDYSLVIDREARTVASANRLGFTNVSEGESKDLFALQMADILAGLVAKLMKALSQGLRYRNVEETTRKKLLDEGWFKLTDERFELYRSFYRVAMRLNNTWNKIYSGVYTDDLICFTTLLAFVNSFSSANELRRNLKMRPEHYNAAVCDELIRHYSIIKNRWS
ncbi:hypothetical protein GMI69_01185 [Eggerthellaceae bacterium zg-887]|nr:hypothetical protein [Xiamenia xianingshaonis]